MGHNHAVTHAYRKRNSTSNPTISTTLWTMFTKCRYTWKIRQSNTTPHVDDKHTGSSPHRNLAEEQKHVKLRLQSLYNNAQYTGSGTGKGADLERDFLRRGGDWDRRPRLPAPTRLLGGLRDRDTERRRDPDTRRFLHRYTQRK